MNKHCNIFSSYLVTFLNFSLSSGPARVNFSLSSGPARVNFSLSSGPARVNFSLRSFQQNYSDGSGHQNGFVDPTSDKFATTSEVEFSGNDFLSSGIHYSTSMCNMYLCDLRSGQRRDLYFASIWANNELCPDSSKRAKTTQFFQDYVILSDLQ